MDVTMPDGTVIQGVPEGTTKAQLAAKYQAHMGGQAQAAPSSATKTFGRGVAQGLTFNMADEIFAGLDAVTQPVLGRGREGATLGERYDANLGDQRARFKTDAEANPVSDIGGNVVGTLLGPAKIAKSAKSIWGLAKEGAKAGTLFGFGAGEGGFGDRVESAAQGAGIGAATGGVLGGAGKLYEKVRPGNIAAKFVNKQYNSPMVADSAKSMHEVGQIYTPGQATGSRGLLTVEGLLRRHPASADKMAEFDQKQVETSLAYLDKTLTGISNNRASPDIVGDRVATAFDDVLKKAVKARRSTATRDFDEVDRLAGNYRVFKPQNLFGEIDELTKDFMVPGGGDASASLVKQIQGIKADIMQRAGPQGLKAKEVQRLLEVYGKAAAGKGAVFKDMETGQQRMIAGKLMQAVLRDVDDAANNSAHQGQIGMALKTARENYRKNSGAIDSLESSVLGRLFGGTYERSPERIAEAVKKMKPTELRASFAVLNKSDPAVAQAAKRYLIEDALATAGRTNTAAPQAQIAGEEVFSPAKYLTAIRKSPVWAAFSPKEKEQMTASVRDLERIAFRNGTDGSPTAPLQFAWEVAKGLGSGGMALSPTQMAKSLATVVVPNRMVKMVTTPEGQAGLSRILRQRPGSLPYRAATPALPSLFTGTDE